MSSPQQEQVPEIDLHAAREVACRVVADRWPEMASVEPTVTPRKHRLPSGDVLARAGFKPGEAAGATEPGVAEYTFTFATETATPEGHSLPRIARVTVDSHRRVVKTTVSK